MPKDNKLPVQKEKTLDPLMRNEHPGADENPNEDEMRTIRRGGSRRSFPADPEKENQDDKTKMKMRRKLLSFVCTV